MPPPEPRTGAVLLAAGQAKRFGGGKLMAEFRGRPLWERAARTAEAIDFSERVVVIEPDSRLAAAWGGCGSKTSSQCREWALRSLQECARLSIAIA
ncbi:MAG: NTP transferase domain-containing protein [Erythrobacter sp.]|nr:NTP transferase domain-containing protein [Erythrobacter sp.]